MSYDPRPLNASNRTSLTREGWLWLLLTTAMLVTGLIKSINLITLVACFLLAMLVMNYVLAGRQLRFLRARRLIDEPIFAGTLGSIIVQVHHPRAAVHGIRLEDGTAPGTAAWFLPQLRKNDYLDLRHDLFFPHRGRYPWGPLHAVCGYPLGLVRRGRQLQEGRDVLVLPRLGELHAGVLRRFLSQASPTQGQARAYPRRHPSAQTEFHGLRSFRAGDSPRWIHWRTSARRGELMVREFEDMPLENLVLIVDPWLPANPTPEENERLELLLSLAATICWDWCRHKGDRLALVVAGEEVFVHAGTTGPDLALALLERLALENGCTPSNPAAVVKALGQAELPAGPILVVSTRAASLVSQVHQSLHRSAAHVNVTRNDHAGFFQPAPEAQMPQPEAQAKALRLGAG